MYGIFSFIFLQFDKQLQYSSLLWQASELLFLPKLSVKTLMRVRGRCQKCLPLGRQFIFSGFVLSKMIFEGYLEDGLI